MDFKKIYLQYEDLCSVIGSVLFVNATSYWCLRPLGQELVNQHSGSGRKVGAFYLLFAFLTLLIGASQGKRFLGLVSALIFTFAYWGISFVELVCNADCLDESN